MHRLFFAVSLLVFLWLNAYGSALAQSDAVVVRTIAITGANRTRHHVIRRELTFKEGDTVTVSDLAASRQALLNLQLFATVEVSEDRGDVVIRLEERWTTIPIFKLSSGGGATELIVGLYDINLFGRFIEGGAQYQRLGETNSGVLWSRLPLWFNHNLSFYLQAWRLGRVRTKYVQGEIEPTVLTGFFHSRAKYYAGLDYQATRRFDVGLFYEYHDDEFSYQYLTEEVRAAAKQKGLPPATHADTVGLRLRPGRIDYDGYLQHGTALQYTVKRTNVMGRATDMFADHEVELSHYETLFSRHTFATRLQAGYNDTSVLQYWYYLGGLDKIRGFADNRFAGNRFWQVNGEYRFPTFESSQVVLQNVFFFDSVAAGDDEDVLRRASGSAAGAGVRLIMPRIYRLVARLDYAFPLVKEDGRAISFGVQQFF